MAQFSGVPLPGVAQFVIGTGISLLAAFLLFAATLTAFPTIEPRFRLANVWRGALLSAVLFQVLTFIWPLYAHFSNFHKYGAILASLLVLTAWIYFFAMIALLGAEAIAISAIRQAQCEGESVGPDTEESVPQHKVLRGGQSQAS